MKGTVIVLGATLIAAVIASIESPSPDSPAKLDANAKTDLRPPADSPAKAEELKNLASPTIAPALPEK